jgi:hypothetical protein
MWSEQRSSEHVSMEVRIGDRALPQLVHQISATCIPWFRSAFAAPDLYSCNRFAVVSQRAHHVLAKHMPKRKLMHRMSRVSFLHVLGQVSATCVPWFRNDFDAHYVNFCNRFAVVWQCARHIFARHMPMRPLVHRS